MKNIFVKNPHPAEPRQNQQSAPFATSRRTFLKTATQAGLLLAAGGLISTKRARADVFGVFPKAQEQLILPANMRVENVLEIYLYGGLSPWETLYYVDQYGKNSDTFWWQYQNLAPEALDSNQAAITGCSLSDADITPQFFAKDELGNDVFLGPFAYAFKDRPDFVERMRLMVQRHNLLPHEAAVPMALTGKAVGQPSMAGLGAHIQRFLVEEQTRASANANNQRRTPWSYVLASGAAIPSDNTAAFVATGTHPGFARPLRINVDDVARLSLLLERQGVKKNSDDHDALVKLYVDQYRNRLQYGRQANAGTNTGANQGNLQNASLNDVVRAPRFRDLEEAVRSVRNTDAVRGVLNPNLFEPVLSDLCASGEQNNLPLQSLRIAADLLTRDEEPAKYVCVVDSGLITASGGGGYDTHSDQCMTTLRNFTNLLRSLSEVVNRPGENDPKKLNLEKTLVILNTEFGRTPAMQAGVGGRNHHCNGYVTAFLGGPVVGRTIVGAIDENAEATSFSTPAENRMAALLAMGIFPFSGDSFFLSDIPAVSTEPDAIVRITKNFLGVSL